MKKSLLQLAIVCILVNSSSGQKTDSLETILLRSTGIERVDILIQLSELMWHNDPNQAMVYSQEALGISKGLKDSVKISQSLRHMGATHFYLGNYDQASDYNKRSLGIALKIGDSLLISQGYHSTGILMSNLSNYPTALEYFIKSKDINDKIGGIGLASSLNNMGLVFGTVGERTIERAYLLEAYEVSVKTNDKRLKAHIQNNLGNNHIATAELTIARNFFSRALVLSDEMDNIHFGSSALQGIGEILFLEGRYDSANYFYQKSLEASNSIGDRKNVSRIYYLQSKLLNAQNITDESITALDRSHEIARELGVGAQMSENLKLYSEIYKNINDFQNSNRYLTEYDKLRDSLFNESTIRNLSLIPIKVKEENDRIILIEQQAELSRQNSANKFYIIILVLLTPMMVFLIILLRKNRTTNSVLREKNEELEQTQGLLVQSEKMASLGVLAAGVGHEINNPLNFIKNGALSLFEQIKEDNKGSVEHVERYFDIISTGVNRVSSIVKSLSQFSRDGVHMDEHCDIHKIMENCLAILNSELKHKSEIIKNFTEDSVIVEGNDGKLHQVFINILSNAGHAIEKEGTITISTEAKEGMVIVSIRDTGIGISEENLLKIHDPFFTTKASGIGTGLGLSISHSIVEEHKGQIYVSSDLSSGTDVVVNLPMNLN